ncbi:tetratricopeptide repeat (TPR)-like superfamily protein [Wolffia australiana]
MRFAGLSNAATVIRASKRICKIWRSFGVPRSEFKSTISKIHRCPRREVNRLENEGTTELQSTSRDRESKICSGRSINVRRQSKSGSRNPKNPARSNKEAPKAPYMREIIASVSRILRSSTWEEAQRDLKAIPVKWDSYTVNQVLKTHPPMEKAWLFFVWVAQVKGFKHDHFTYTTMLDIFGEAGRISSMELMLKEMKERGLKIDAAACTSAMAWFAKVGDLEKAIELWKEMKEGGYFPTVVSYTAFMKILFDHGREKEASRVFKEMIEAGLSPNCHTYTVMIEHLAGSGRFEAALEIMNEMREAEVEPDKATCNILVKKCSEFGEITAMTKVLRYMKDKSLVLRLPVFLDALESLRRAGQSDLLLREVNPHLLAEELRSSSDVNVANPDSKIVGFLLCKRNFAAMDVMLEAMLLKNKELGEELVSDIILASSRRGFIETALLAFLLSVKLEQTLHSRVYISLLGPLLRSGRVHDALKIAEQMKKEGRSLGIYLDSVLSLGLVWAGKPAIAAGFLSSSPTSEKSSLTYTCLIYVYLQSMEVEKGLETYARMREEGFSATLGTFEVLILGMEKAGRKNNAEFFRKERRKLLQRSFSKGSAVPVDESLCDLFFASGW